MSRKSYPTDVSDAEWSLIEPMIPRGSKRKRGRHRSVDLREVINAIFYIIRAGCSWRMLPHDLPPWQTVYSYFQRWKRQGVWSRIHAILRSKLREIEGRDPELYVRSFLTARFNKRLTGLVIQTLQWI